PEVAVALRRARKFRPNADPTRVPSPALYCPKRCESEYGVPVGAPPCTPLGRTGNAVYRVTGIEGSNPSRSGFPLQYKGFRVRLRPQHGGLAGPFRVPDANADANRCQSAYRRGHEETHRRRG